MSELEILAKKLSRRLERGLPGLVAQLKMAGMKRLKLPFKLSNPGNAVPSGVLLLLYPSGSEIYFVLIRRPDYTGIHSGQIGLPGGKYEEHDRDLVDTALREAKEETGIDPSKVRVLGTLTPLYIPPSNYIVTPVLGWSECRPEFKPDPREVDEILEVSLTRFLDDRVIQQKRIRLFVGLSAKFPCFYIDRNIIWGATAMMLSEFRSILMEIQ